MTGEVESLCLRLLDLARGQKAAIEAGDLDEVLALAEKRQGVIVQIQKIDSSGAAGRPAVPEPVVRQIRSIDEEAGGMVKEQLREVSDKLNEINTLKVLCRGVFEEAQLKDASRKP